MNFTIQQIKDAFYKTFHNQGEIWFSDREGNTEFYWEDFADNLQKSQWQDHLVKSGVVDMDALVKDHPLMACPRCGGWQDFNHEQTCEGNE